MIEHTSPRTNVQMTLPDGSTWQAPINTRLEDILRAAYPNRFHEPGGRDGEHPSIVAALVDGNLEELTIRLKRDAVVTPVSFDDTDGVRIYRRSLSFLLIVAAAQLFPHRQIQISHSLPFGGYYGTVVDGEPFNAEEIAQIKARMIEIAQADEPITRHITPHADAVALFENNGSVDKVRLLLSRAAVRNEVPIYELMGQRDYFFGYMVPSTGYLNTFDLVADDGGFMLRYARRAAPGTIEMPYSLPKLRSVFEETEDWLRLLDVPDVGALNLANQTGRLAELVLVAEALHESRYADIADMVHDRRDAVKVVLIAGPSSSGKTTSSKRLAIQLMAHGLKPYTIAMDEYFVPREMTPRDEHGEYDFENLQAVDIKLFNDHLLRLMAGEEVQLPSFNFRTGQRSPGTTAQIGPDHVIIVEGIHALNPEFVRAIPPQRVFRIYVSCLTQLNMDHHNRVPTTDMRLLRRIVRDAATRGYSAQETIARWDSVQRGERKWIFPFQENADVMFNSALVYELAALRPLAEPLLRQIDPPAPEYVEAKRLLSFLTWVEPFTLTDLVPGNSVLREFIGGSLLEHYTPGHATF